MKEKLEEVLKSAQKWYSENSLLNNQSKTEIMIITSKKNKESYKNQKYDITENMKTIKIKPKENMKILGLWVEEDLKWHKQISNMKAKAFNNARNLGRINQILPMKSKIQLYNSYVASQLSYGDIIWGGCSEGNKKKLQSVQNFSLKSMTGKSSEEARRDLHFLTLEDKRSIHYGTHGYKLANGKAPSNLTKMFDDHRPRSRRLQDLGVMKPPIHKTEQYKMSTIYKTIACWNSIPAIVKNKTTTDSFKSNLQKWKCQP